MVKPLKYTMSYGVTINKGNYESARIDYSEEFTSDIPRAVAFDKVKHFVLKRMEDEKR